MPSKWFQNGQSDILYYFGAAAEELYLPGGIASGDLTGEIASNVLVSSGPPTYEQVLTGWSDDPLGAGFVDASGAHFECASTSVHDYTTGSFALLVALNITATPSTYRAITGKRQESGDLNGYEVQVASSLYGFACDAGASLIRADVAVAPTTGLHYMFVWRQGTTVGLRMDVGENTNTIGIGDSLTNSGGFSIGETFISSFEGVVGPVTIWSGANAETVIANRSTVLPDWWADKWFRNGQSDISYFFGADAEEIYQPGEPASGNITGKIASNVLTATVGSGTISYQQPLTNGSDDPKGVICEGSTTARFEAASTSVHSYSTGAFACLVAFKIPAPDAGKILGSNPLYDHGWSYYVDSAGTRISWVLYDTADTPKLYYGTNAEVGKLQFAFGWRSVVEDKTGQVRSWGAPQEAEDLLGDLTNAQVFTLGGHASRVTVGAIIGPVVIWSGANAETVIANRLTAFDDWWDFGFDVVPLLMSSLEEFMPKTQFASNEDLLITFPPFIDKTTGERITAGTDTASLVVKKPDNTTMGTPPTPSWDSDINMWRATISSSAFEEGQWLVLASTDDSNGLDQYLSYTWGDYVDDILEARQAAMGRWKIESNQLVLYEEDGLTVLRTFDLKDSDGNPTMTRIFERDPV